MQEQDLVKVLLRSAVSATTLPATMHRVEKPVPASQQSMPEVRQMESARRSNIQISRLDMRSLLTSPASEPTQRGCIYELVSL